MKKGDFGRIGVLAGGLSNEREISLKSGSAVHKALLGEGCDVILLDARDDIHDIIKKNKIDVAFIALHGRFGEDGAVQKILEDENLPYTGSGVDASALALDKAASKARFERRGIPTPGYGVFEKDKLRIEDAHKLGFPMVVKPQMEGSSIGLSIVAAENYLEEAVARAFRYGTKIILEEYIDGRELTVGILDDEPLPVIEIVTRNRVYDYAAKYDDPDTKYIVPAPIGNADSEKAKMLGKRAHEALGCRFFSRVDMMMDKRGDVFVLEVNTIPGMTERSLLPKAAEASGVSFGQLCVKMVENALTREYKNETTKKI